MQKRSSSSVKFIARWAVPWLVAGAGPALGQPGAAPPSPGPGLEVIAPLDNARTLGYFVAGDAASAVNGTDAELCIWALNDWVRHAEGRLEVAQVPESEAVIRVYLVSPGAGRYGEMRPIRVGNLRGAAVYVRTETNTLGPEIATAADSDVLLRDTIVYLTCLHELGHALGMFHTAEYEDVMYFFGLGGDIPRFFGRYRSRLGVRDDISRQSGLSAGDIEQLLEAYPEE